MRIATAKLVDDVAGRALARLLARRADSTRLVEPPRRVLLVKFWGLGSIVLGAGVARAARAAFPEARVDMLTLASNREICEHLALFDRVRTVRIDRWYAFGRTGLGTLAELVREPYDVVVDLELFAYVSALAGVAARAPRRVGFDKGARSLFTDVVPFDGERHVLESFRALASRLVGGEPRGFDLSIPRSAAASASVASTLAAAGVGTSDVVVAMNVNASPLAYERRWERSRFAELAGWLSARYGAHVVLTGSSDERDYVGGLVGELRGPAAVTNLAGRLSIAELVALVDRSDLVVTNDSGPLHLASALDRPTIALFGPETPARYGPLASRRLVCYASLACSPCMSVENRKTVNCRYDALCMRSMTARWVFERAEPFIESVLGRTNNSSATPSAADY